MREVLSELNKTSGITGSMVVGNDGIVIASDLNAKYEEDTIGALASSISSTVDKSLQRLQQKPSSSLTIEGDDGKLFISQTEIGYLVVTTENKVNLGLIRLEMKNAATQLNL